MTPSWASARAQRAGPAWPVRMVSCPASVVDTPSCLGGPLVRGPASWGGCGVWPSTDTDEKAGLVSPGRPSSYPPSAECLLGHYGAGCQLSCSCLNGGTCDRLSGHCLCPAGWTGDKCQRREWVLGSWEVLPRVTRFYSILKTWAKTGSNQSNALLNRFRAFWLYLRGQPDRLVCFCWREPRVSSQGFREKVFDLWT